MLNISLGVTALLILSIYWGAPGFILGITVGYILFKLNQITQRIIQLEQGKAVTSPAPTVTETSVTNRYSWGIAENARITANQPIKQDAQLDKTAGAPANIERYFQVLVNYFSSGNIIAKIGIVVLFFGFAFLIKYAAEFNVFAVEFRLAIAGIASIVLLSIGWRLRVQRREYALALQGGGIGLLYIIIFSAYRFYDLLPANITFLSLVVIAICGVILALLQNAQSLAYLAVSGGFLAPILASPASDDPLGLFSYYAILNSVIVIIAWYKTWRPLNVIGFLFTFLISASWGAYSYKPEHFLVTEAFLILFFIMYFAISILHASKQPPHLKGFVDGTLIFGVPLILCSLQSVLVAHIPYGNAFNCLTLALFYATAALLLFRKNPQHFHKLTEAFISLAVIFSTLVVPLTLSGKWTSVIWAIEATCILWIGIRQQQVIARLFSYLLLLLAQFIFLDAYLSAPATASIINFSFSGAVLIAVANLYASFFSYRDYINKRSWEKTVSVLLFSLAIAWWVSAGWNEINILFSLNMTNDVIGYLFGTRGLIVINMKLLFLAASALLAWNLYYRKQWQYMYYPAISLLPIMVLFSVVTAVFHQQYAWFPWTITLSCWYWILKQHEPFSPTHLEKLHLFSGWLLVWQLAYSVNYIAMHIPLLATIWAEVSWGLIPLLTFVLIQHLKAPSVWPVLNHQQIYQKSFSNGLITYLSLWLIYINLISTAAPAPLIYLPLLNPLDIVCILSLLFLAKWYYRTNVTDWNSIALRHTKVYVMLLLFWLNMVLLRTLHHWANIPFNWDALFDSRIAQTAFSIYWITLAMIITIMSSRLQIRKAWFVGFGIICFVTLKLFLIDLTISNVFYRTFSFIAVGLLLLIIGYLSPLPPNEDSVNPRSKGKST